MRYFAYVFSALPWLALAFLVAAADLPGSPAPSQWQGVHSVQDAQPKDFPELAARGINVIQTEIGSRRASWERYYTAARKHDIKLIPMIWDPRKRNAIWDWNSRAGEWELNIERYPRSVGAQFLDFLRRNPAYLRRTFAIYAFHEPSNVEHETIAIQRQRAFWDQIHLEEFPEGNLLILGESVSWHPGCETRCVDYDGITMFFFATCGGGANYRPPYFAYKQGRLVKHSDRCTEDREFAIQRSGEFIDFVTDFRRRAAEKTGGPEVRSIVSIQTYASSQRRTLWNRMPSASEMSEWVERVILPRTDKIAGLQWYSWRQIAGVYVDWLHKDRFDDSGQDRWQVLRDVSKKLPEVDAEATRHPDLGRDGDS